MHLLRDGFLDSRMKKKKTVELKGLVSSQRNKINAELLNLHSTFIKHQTCHQSLLGLLQKTKRSIKIR
jgi:hypothetical protein